MVSGFRKTGIDPINPQPVLSRLPQGRDDDDHATCTSVSEAFMGQRQQMRYGDDTQQMPRRKKRD